MATVNRHATASLHRASSIAPATTCCRELNAHAQRQTWVAKEDFSAESAKQLTHVCRSPSASASPSAGRRPGQPAPQCCFYQLLVCLGCSCAPCHVLVIVLVCSQFLSFRQSNQALTPHPHSRTAGATLSGCAAGILGLTGLKGFALYVLVSILMSATLWVHTGEQRSKFFRSSMDLLWEGITGNLFTYILFWTVLYGMVHIY